MQHSFVKCHHKKIFKILSPAWIVRSFKIEKLKNWFSDGDGEGEGFDKIMYRLFSINSDIGQKKKNGYSELRAKNKVPNFNHEKENLGGK